jgi:hypothetical protein
MPLPTSVAHRSMPHPGFCRRALGVAGYGCCTSRHSLGGRVSRHESTRRQVKLRWAPPIATAPGRNVLNLLPAGHGSKSRPFFHAAGYEPNRARQSSRSSVAAMLLDGCPGGACRPRKTLEPGIVQEVCFTIPWLAHSRLQSLNGSLPGRSARSTVSRVAKGWHPIKAMVVHQSTYWLTALGLTVKRSSASHRKASSHIACGSRHAPVCARAP